MRVSQSWSRRPSAAAPPLRVISDRVEPAQANQPPRALDVNGEGRAFILLGQVLEGLALLDESTVAAMSGELDAILGSAETAAAAGGGWTLFEPRLAEGYP